VEESLNGLPVNVSDKVARPQTGLKGRTSPVNLHDQMVNGVEIRVSEIDSNGSDCKSETFWATPDNDWSV
jgi:hypothetical protein